MTLRTPDELLERVRRAAEESGRSMNDYVVTVLDAATNPELAGDQMTRIRERLARAGILGDPGGPRRKRPDEADFEKARAAAGRGKPLSDYVSEGRG